MKRCSKLLVGMLICIWMMPLSVGAQLIPVPNHVTKQEGSFVWNRKTRVNSNLKGVDKQQMGEYLNSLPYSVNGKGGNVIKLTQTPLKNTKNREAYQLNITTKSVEIKANSAAGIFYGLQTLLQLGEEQTEGLTVPCVSITDEPRFGHRGFMLDISRHFFPKEFILKQIDMLSSFKVNVLHLHLADTGGWRIEIKKYPQLTQQTAYRTHCDWQEWTGNGSKFCEKNDQAYGGFFTQEEMKEIIHYAAVHQMEVIPEIDIPGHSSEVLQVLPELRCKGKPSKWVSELCIGNEQTYKFCEDVLEEIMALFPSKYMHIGGDEASTASWAQCETCQKKMKEEHIDDVKHYQSYFTRRIEQFVNAHGKTIIGWDEMLDGDITKSATILSWHEDPQGRDRAISKGNHMIISSESQFYLDYYQDNPSVEPLCFGGYTPLSSTYNFNPTEGLKGDTTLVKGVQCNLWTEAIQTPEHAEHMIYPRVIAMAEVGWSQQSQKNFADFRNRTKVMVKKMEKKGYHPFDLTNEFGSRPGSNIKIHTISTGKKVQFNTHWSQNFDGEKEVTLTDGKISDWGMNGMRWLGFDANMNVVVDLEKETDIHSVRTSFMQNSFTSMYIPDKYEIRISNDGKEFTPLYTLNYPYDKKKKYDIVDLGWSGETKARYVQVIAKHSDGWCWLMCDELIVE